MTAPKNFSLAYLITGCTLMAVALGWILHPILTLDDPLSSGLVIKMACGVILLGALLGIAIGRRDPAYGFLIGVVAGASVAVGVFILVAIHEIIGAYEY